MDGTTVRRLALGALLGIALMTAPLAGPVNGIALAQCGNPGPSVSITPPPSPGEIDPGPSTIDPYDVDWLLDLIRLELP